MTTTLQQLISQAKDRFHQASKRNEQLGDAATDEQRQELADSQAELLDLLNRERDATGGGDDLDELKVKFDQRKTTDATRKFHEKAQAELQAALKAVAAADNAVSYFDASQFVPDPTDSSRPLFRTRSGNLVSITEGVAAELPSSLRRGAAADLAELKSQLARAEQAQAAAKRKYSGGLHRDPSQLGLVERAKREANQIRRKIDELTATPAAKGNRDIAAEIAIARVNLETAKRQVNSTQASRLALGAFADAKRRLAELEKQLQTA
jgi:hypothetical protein